jgi:hypothetical protein
MLAARITLPHLSVSSAMSFPNAADVIDIGQHTSLSFGIVRGQVHEHANAPHRLPLLRARRERPRGRRAA